MKNLLLFLGILLTTYYSCSAQYCPAPFADGSTADYHIDGVSMAGFNNLNNGYVDTASYQDYSSLGPIQVNSGETYLLTVYTPGFNNDKIAIWCDYNGDNTFSNIELVDIWANWNGVTVFSIPINSYFGIGPKRLRIREMPSGVVNPTPCYNAIDPTSPGETEDYTLNINNVAPVYCTPIYYNGTSNGDFINSVYMNTMSNIAQTAIDSFPFFQNFTTTVPATTLYPGVGYTLRVGSGMNPGSTYAVWLDFNRDSAFDISEKLGEQIATYSFAQLNFVVAYPLTATEGLTRLRIRCASAVTGLDACATYNDGETEDYIVNIQLSAPDYCTSNLQLMPCWQQDVINTVTIQGTTLNNVNTLCDFNTTGYVNWNIAPYTTANLDVMTFYNFEVTSSASSQIRCWLDFNHDNIFQYGECYNITDVSQANIPSMLSIWIPYDALPGPTRMRIRSCSATGEPMYPGDACMPFSSGQTEDYTINIINNTVGVQNIKTIEALSVALDESNTANISFRSLNQQQVNMSIKDMLGRTILNESNIANTGENKFQIPLETISTGIYVLTIKANENIYSTKFFIK